MSEAVDGFGTVATAGLLAREVERAHADQPAIGHAADEACANCGAHRHGPYCHVCGQAGHIHRDWTALVHDLAHGVFHFEGKIWRTLPLLAWHPGRLTRRYVHGERAKFVSPMALFLFAVFLMFAAISGTGHHGPRAGDATASVREAARQVTSERSAAQTRLDALRAARPGLPAGEARDRLDRQIADAVQEAAVLDRINRVVGPAAPAGAAAATQAGHDTRTIAAEGLGRVDTGLPWIDAVARHAAANPELTAYKLKSYAYKYSWALIPISLPFLWLLFAFRRDVGLYDHAIFAIYSLSFMSFGVTVLLLAGALRAPAALVPLAAILVPPVHMYRQLKGAYSLGRFGAMWRTAALLLITAITSSLFFAFLIYMGTD